MRRLPFPGRASDLNYNIFAVQYDNEVLYRPHLFVLDCLVDRALEAWGKDLNVTKFKRNVLRKELQKKNKQYGAQLAKNYGVQSRKSLGGGRRKSSSVDTPGIYL